MDLEEQGRPGLGWAGLGGEERRHCKEGKVKVGEGESGLRKEELETGGRGRRRCFHLESGAKGEQNRKGWGQAGQREKGA